MNISSTRKAIQEGNRKFGTAVKGKDYAGMATLYHAYRLSSG